MKKTIIVFIIFLVPFYVKGQNDTAKEETFPRFQWSAYAGYYGMIPTKDIFPLGQESKIDPYLIPFGFPFMSPSFDMYGKYVHGHIQYHWKDTAMLFLFMSNLKNNWELYSVIEKPFINSKASFGIGTEKVIETKKRVNFIVFWEFDSGFSFEREDFFGIMGILVQVPFAKVQSDIKKPSSP